MGQHPRPAILGTPPPTSSPFGRRVYFLWVHCRTLPPVLRPPVSSLQTQAVLGLSCHDLAKVFGNDGIWQTNKSATTPSTQLNSATYLSSPRDAAHRTTRSRSWAPRPSDRCRPGCWPP